jgi:anti-sigma-K factor RskA
VEPNLTMARHAEARDLLGAFALGALDAQEAAAVRAHLATCAECQAEIALLWSAVDALPELVEPMDPPPELRGRIATAILEDASAPQTPPAPLSIASPAPAAAPPAPERRLAEPIRPAAWWSRATPWVAAAAILLLVSGGLLAWNLRLQQQIAAVPTPETIALAPTDAAPDAGGHVTYLPDENLLLLNVQNLPALESGQVYEVWLLDQEGVPSPVGVFDQATDQHAIVADRGQYTTLAITAEPGPLGSEAPTGEIVATAPL